MRHSLSVGAAPLRVQRAVSRLWEDSFSSEDEALRSLWFSQLASECHAAYGAPEWFARESDSLEDESEGSNCLDWHKRNLKTALRNLGAPWFGDASTDALAMAEVVHFGYEGGPSRRTYLVPLDRAPADLPRAKFRPCRIGRFSADELADIINPAALERHRRAQFDLEKFCQFGWLVVEEEVQLEQAARRDWLTRFLDTTFEPFGSVDVHSRRFPEIIERALVTLLLHPWEEFISFSGQSWEPFAVPWIYVVDSDPFEAPRRVPDPTSLSWKPDETPDGHLIERASPVTAEFTEKTFDDFETKLCRNYTLLAEVCPLGTTSHRAFNPLIEHFLLRACWEEGIDQLIMHMTAIDAAIGKQQQGMTKAIRKRLKRLLNHEAASQAFETLYTLRSAYIHGRGEDRPIPASQLVAARRLARRAAEAVLCYATAHPNATRDQMLDELDLGETDGPVRGPSLYDQDFAAWVERQVELLRSGHTTALDVPHLIEELEGLTKRDERALGSQLKRIMAHMLKQRYQPQRASRSWVDWIENGREEIEDILEQSPSLRRTLPGLMTKNYPRAVSQASRDTRMPPEGFPSEPPFSLEEVLGDETRIKT